MKYIYIALFVISSSVISCNLLVKSGVVKTGHKQHVYVRQTLSQQNSEKKVSCTKVPIKVAVVDTGFGLFGFGKGAKLCKFGHKDFSIDNSFLSNYEYGTKDPVPRDFHGHGTNVVGLIDKYAKNSGVEYCVVVIKYHSDLQTDEENSEAEFKAIRYATIIKADFLNLSGGGIKYDVEEAQAVHNYINSGGHFIAAAGNENNDLADLGFYPGTSDTRSVIVGSLSDDGEISEFSNYGDRVDVWEYGENVTAYGTTFSGTSQATAIATGKMLARSKNKCYTK